MFLVVLGLATSATAEPTSPPLSGGFGYMPNNGWGTLHEASTDNVALSVPTLASQEAGDQIFAAAQPHLAELQRCYEQAHDAKLEGTVTTTFHVDPTGKLGALKSRGLAKLNGCVTKVLGALALGPLPGGAVDVSYPIAFRPTSAAPAPPVWLKKLDAQGPLDNTAMRRFLRRSLPQLAACFQSAQPPAPGGTVHVSFFVNPAGKVVTASARGFAGVAPCVERVLRALDLPKGQEVETANVTLRFGEDAPTPDFGTIGAPRP